MKTLDELAKERANIKAQIAKFLDDDSDAALRGMDPQHKDAVQELRYRMDVNEAAANVLRRSTAS